MSGIAGQEHPWGEAAPWSMKVEAIRKGLLKRNFPF
jgi:hypothetical protein